MVDGGFGLRDPARPKPGQPTLACHRRPQGSHMPVSILLSRLKISSLINSCPVRLRVVDSIGEKKRIRF